MKIGLYFGTFNPIHVGHLVIANYLVEHTELEQVWLVVSPQNPFKNKASLLSDFHRLSMVKIAIEENSKLQASDIEFQLSKPSYTVTTLAFLAEKYPQHVFSLIMGEDNLRTFHKWFNYEQILRSYTFYVYPRLLTEQEEVELQSKGKDTTILYSDLPNVHMLKEAPLMKISASFIRDSIREGKDVRYLLTEPVQQYIDEMNFYK